MEKEIKGLKGFDIKISKIWKLKLCLLMAYNWSINH